MIQKDLVALIQSSCLFSTCSTRNVDCHPFAFPQKAGGPDLPICYSLFAFHISNPTRATSEIRT